MIKLKMNTDLLKFIEVSTYGTYLDIDLCQDENGNIPDDILKEYHDIIVSNTVDTIKEVLKDNSINCTIKNASFESPTYYNYGGDWVNFDLYLCDSTLQKMKSIAYDDDFIQWIKDQYKSYSGFISFMPYSKKTYVEKLENDLERCFGAYISYLTKDEAETIKESLIDGILDDVACNGLEYYDDLD